MLHQKSTAASLKEDGPPPFLGTWYRVYAAILVYPRKQRILCVRRAAPDQSATAVVANASNNRSADA